MCAVSHLGYNLALLLAVFNLVLECLVIKWEWWQWPSRGVAGMKGVHLWIPKKGGASTPLLQVASVPLTSWAGSVSQPWHLSSWLANCLIAHLCITACFITLNVGILKSAVGSWQDDSAGKGLATKGLILWVWATGPPWWKKGMMITSYPLTSVPALVHARVHK